jgi:hydroxymethylbilane synthase
LRRQAQILAARPDLQVLPIRGNVDTRIRKLKSGEYDAVILATAGAKRSGLFDAACMTPIDAAAMLPAAAQGVLALQCRKNDSRMIGLLGALNDADTSLAVRAERQVVQLLNGDCHSPIAALATIAGSTLTLRTAVAAKGGHPPVLTATATADKNDPESAATAAVAQLDKQGVRAILH